MTGVKAGPIRKSLSCAMMLHASLYPWQASSRHGECRGAQRPLATVGCGRSRQSLARPTLRPSADAADKSLERQGRGAGQENCSPLPCDRQGRRKPAQGSAALPHPVAKYPIDDLAESLAEGIVSGHPDMPIFVFSAARRRGDHPVYADASRRNSASAAASLGLGGQRHGVRAPRPGRELRRVVEQALRHLPIGHGDRRPALATDR